MFTDKKPQYIFVHEVVHCDDNDNVLEVIVCCSDSCASEVEGYNGWSGCHELEVFAPTTCYVCGGVIGGGES
jgi:hypothetical protein